MAAGLDPGDGLEADNHRHRVVEVRERIKVLMVEGSDEDDPRLTETELMRALLDPTGGNTESPELLEFAPVVMPYVEFLAGAARFDDFDLVVLGNLRELNGTVAASLRNAVANGLGLIILVGDRTDPGATTSTSTTRAQARCR